MFERKFPVDPDLCTYVERLDYEVRGLRTLNCQLIRLNCEGQACDDFRAKLLEKTAEYHFAINELVQMMVPEEARGSIKTTSVNFVTGMLHVTMEGGE